MEQDSNKVVKTSGDFLGFNKSQAITGVTKTFEKGIIPGTSSVIKRDITVDPTKVQEFVKIEDVYNTTNPEMRKEIAGFIGYRTKDEVGDIVDVDGNFNYIPFSGDISDFKKSQDIDVDTKIRSMNLAGATHFVFLDENDKPDLVPIPYDVGIQEFFKEKKPPPSGTEMLFQMQFPLQMEATRDLPRRKISEDQGRLGDFFGLAPFMKGTKVGVTLDAMLGTNFDSDGALIRLAKQYDKVLANAGLNSRQRYGILKERMANKFADLQNIMGYGRRGVRFGIEAPIFIAGETYDILTEAIKASPLGKNLKDEDIPFKTGIADTVSRVNFYDMIAPMQAAIIQDGFADKNIKIDLGTAELLASMFSSTAPRAIAQATEIGVPSEIAKKVTMFFGKKTLKQYKRYVAEQKARETEDNVKPLNDAELFNKFADYKRGGLPFYNDAQVGNLPIAGKVFKFINGMRTGPQIIQGLQIDEAAKSLRNRPDVVNAFNTHERLLKQRENFVDTLEGKAKTLQQEKSIGLLDRQIQNAQDELHATIVESTVPKFIRDISKQNKYMIIGASTMGQLGQETESGDPQVFEMIGLLTGLTLAMTSNSRFFIGKMRGVANYMGFDNKQLNLAEELAKRVNTFSPEFAQKLQTRIKYIDGLQQEMKSLGVSDDVLKMSFAKMSNLAILQSLEETSRIDISLKKVKNFGSVVEDLSTIQDLKQKTIQELKGAVQNITALTKDNNTEASTKLINTFNEAINYGEKRLQNLTNDLDVIDRHQKNKIKSAILNSSGNVQDSPIDAEDISTSYSRTYKLGVRKLDFNNLTDIETVNKKIDDEINQTLETKAKQLRIPTRLKNAKRQVKNFEKETKRYNADSPTYDTSGDLLVAFVENKRHLENANVSAGYNLLDKSEFYSSGRKVMGRNAQVEGMDLLEGFIENIPKDETEFFKAAAGNTISSTLQSQIFKGFNVAAEETLNRLHSKLADAGRATESVKEFVNDIILDASPELLNKINYLPKSLQAVYILRKEGEEIGSELDSLPLNFDQLKDIKSAFSRLQNKYFDRLAQGGGRLSNAFSNLKNKSTNKFSEFKINFGEENSEFVGDLFIKDSKTDSLIPVKNILQDADTKHQTYMNRYFDNTTNYNKLFKGRNKVEPNKNAPSGLTFGNSPHTWFDFEKISNLTPDRMLEFKDDFYKLVGDYKNRQYSINVNSPAGKSLKSILELKMAQYIEQVADQGRINNPEYRRKLLKIQEAFTAVDDQGKKVTLIDAQKVEKDIFSFSPSNVRADIIEGNYVNMGNRLEFLARTQTAKVTSEINDLKDIQRKLRSVMPFDVKKGNSLAQAMTENPTRLREVKDGLLKFYGGKKTKQEIDDLVSEAYLEDILNQSFTPTGTMTVENAENIIPDVNMNMDRLKDLIGFDDPNRREMVKEIIGEKRFKRFDALVKFASEKFNDEKMAANVTGIPRNFSVESYISRFYSINRGVISARYVGTEAVLQQFRLKGHKLFKAIIENEDAAQLFLETVKSGKPLSGEKELQFFNALTTALFKVNQELKERVQLKYGNR